MKIAYIDTVSTVAPVHTPDHKPWQAHCIRIVVALEDDKEIVGTLLALVEPGPSIEPDRAWIASYGVPGLPAMDMRAAGTIAPAVGDMIHGAQCIAQNASFHRDVTTGLFTDGALPEPRAAALWGCIQREARPIVKALTVAGKPKAPNLGESFQFFTGRTMPLITTLGWREAALARLNAVRAVYAGVARLGRAGGHRGPGWRGLTMSYDYAAERPAVFTERGQVMFLKIRDNAARLMREAGAARMQEIVRGCTGDSWAMLACVDRLIELGEIVEVTAGQKVAGQNRIFTSHQ